ncbi:MAG: GNAT family N-acetyltransferase [Pleurocapsa sp. SU_196_0]|nr:GNAT family N-acetyltransferase [Pleurocapsa sp. SU_196_0]
METKTILLNPAETLETPHLILRLWALEDEAVYARLSDDAEIARLTGTFLYPQPDGWSAQRLTRYVSALEAGTGYNFAVCLRDSLEVIGDCGLFLEPRHRRAELGYWCATAFRGNGYITEAARAVMRFGFDRLGLHRVQAGYFPRNPASRRILEKIGMRREGLMRGYFVKDDVPEDVMYFAVLKSDVET